MEKDKKGKKTDKIHKNMGMQRKG